jgi:hypothetical protein
MPLDNNSLLLSLGIAGGCLAITLFATWFSARKESFLLTWAIGTLLIVTSVFLYSSYVTSPDADTVVVSFMLLIVGFTLIHAAAVQFRSGRVSGRRVAVIGGVGLAVGLGAFATPYDGLGFMLANLVAAALLFATAREYLLVRAEAPGATLGLFALYGLVGVTFLLCAAVLATDGSFVLGHAPTNWAEE